VHADEKLTAFLELERITHLLEAHLAQTPYNSAQLIRDLDLFRERMGWVTLASEAARLDGMAADSSSCASQATLRAK
jgi:hypothetical protein